MKLVLGKKLSIGLVAILIPFLGNAQEQPESIQLTLEEAIEIALNDNPSVIIAGQEVEKKDYAKKEVLGNLLPTIDAVGQYTYTIKKQSMAFGGQTIEMGVENQWVGGFTASMPIIAPTLWKSINLTNKDMQLSLESARASKIDAVTQVKNAFYAVLLSQDSYEVFKRSYENAISTYEDVKHKYENGIVAEYDMIRSNVRVKSLEPNMIQAENAVNLTKMQLKVLMGVNLDVDIQPIGSLKDYENKMYADYLDRDTNLESNSDLKQFDIQNEMLKQNLGLQKAEFLPYLGLSGAYQWLAMNEDFKITGNDYNAFSNIVVSLQIPIFSGGSRVNKIKQTKVSLSQMQTQREDLVRNLQLAVRNYQDAMNKNIEAAAAAKEGVSEAQKGYEIISKMYDTGMATMLEVNEADLARVNAGLQYNQAIYDYLNSKANLDKVLGTDF